MFRVEIAHEERSILNIFKKSAAPNHHAGSRNSICKKHYDAL